MTSSMGPPPPRNTAATVEPPAVSEACPSNSTLSEMCPSSENLKPDIENTNIPQNDSGDDSTVSISSCKPEGNDGEADKKHEPRSKPEVPYTIPSWSEPPCHSYYLEVLKEGSIIDQLDVNKKGAYMFGRVDLCDFVLEHPTISRFHAVLQFNSNGDAYLYDLGSTHGTFVNKHQVKKRAYVELHVGDVLRFGQSSRLYVFQGPNELMLPEGDLKSIRQAKIRAGMQDMEESLLRAKLEASLADGVSWGMREDAIEPDEIDVEEITWQTYKGQLTEKQEKTRDKVIKRLEKIAHMKKEIDAIRAKDIAQGGLTQGQQTQIARNEQRMSQILEELENLEETLNDSIRESLGARTGRVSHRKNKGENEEEEYVSDDDEFYDRTKKPTKQKKGENQSVETADSLLDKRDALFKEMEDKRKLLLSEDNTSKVKDGLESGDDLDVYMSGLSSQLDEEKKDRVQNEVSALQSELDRILYLLKIADPSGEASRKREMRSSSQEPKTDSVKVNPSKTSVGISESSQEKATPDKGVEYKVVKPQWLGAIEEEKRKEDDVVESKVEETDEFIGYKERERIVEKKAGVSVIEDAAPGLIIRKPKQVKLDEAISEESEKMKSSGVVDMEAKEAVALLLKHSRGYHSLDDDENDDERSVEKKKKAKTSIGPDRPPFLASEVSYETWVPPKGQCGDGRTSLNDRYGY